MTEQVTPKKHLYCPSCFRMVIKPTRYRGECDYCGYSTGDFEFWTPDQRDVRRLTFALQSVGTVIVSLLAANARGTAERQRALEDALSEVRKHVAQYVPEFQP